MRLRHFILWLCGSALVLAGAAIFQASIEHILLEWTGLRPAWYWVAGALSALAFGGLLLNLHRRGHQDGVVSTTRSGPGPARPRTGTRRRLRLITTGAVTVLTCVGCCAGLINFGQWQQRQAAAQVERDNQALLQLASEPTPPATVDERVRVTVDHVTVTRVGAIIELSAENLDPDRTVDIHGLKIFCVAKDDRHRNLWSGICAAKQVDRWLHPTLVIRPGEIEILTLEPRFDAGDRVRFITVDIFYADHAIAIAPQRITVDEVPLEPPTD